MGDLNDYILKCDICGREYSPNKAINLCSCGYPPLVKLNLSKLKDKIDRNKHTNWGQGMWQFFELLPLQDPRNRVTIGEGGTPLLHLSKLGREFGLSKLYVKIEGYNPTGTFKARGASMCVSKVLDLGLKDVVIHSAGSAAVAAATYGAKAGIRVHVFIPENAPRIAIDECRMLGAELSLVPGGIVAAHQTASEVMEHEGWYSVSASEEPYRFEGKKTMAYEMAQQLNWVLPDVVIQPTGGGIGLVAMEKGFRELHELGWVDGILPRMVAAQSEGCAPVYEAWSQMLSECREWGDATSPAPGLLVPSVLADRLVLNAIQRSRGFAVAVQDPDVFRTMQLAAKLEGLLIGPESAIALHASRQALLKGLVDNDEVIVVVLTSASLRFPKLLTSVLGS